MSLQPRPPVNKATVKSFAQKTYRNYHPSLSPEYNRNVYEYVNIMRGWNIPNFHKRKVSGELLPYTPYEYFEGKYTNNLGYIKFFFTDYTEYSDHTHDYLPGCDLPYVDDYYGNISYTYCRDLASNYDLAFYVQAAAANVYSQGYDALTSLAELRETISMFTGLRERLIKLLRRGLSLKSLEDIWLEYRYGWRTLYFDMVELSELMASLDDSFKRYTERAGHKEEYTTSSVHTVAWPSLTWDITTTTSISISLRGSVTADIQPPKFAFNPLTTAWELVTLSFVIDWFLKVGTWLQALSFLVLQTDYTAAGGFSLKATRTIEFGNFRSPNNHVHNVSYSGSQTGSVVYKVRTPMRVSTIPHLAITLDVPKFIDLWALVRSLGR